VTPGPSGAGEAMERRLARVVLHARIQPTAWEVLPSLEAFLRVTVLAEMAGVPRRTLRRSCGGTGWSWRQRARLRADAGRHRPPASVRCRGPLSPQALRLLIANLLRSDFGADLASPSDDGGLEEFPEFCASRALSSATSARSASTWARSTLISVSLACAACRNGALAARRAATSSGAGERSGTDHD
jgi:hypothetical protein